MPVIADTVYIIKLRGSIYAASRSFSILASIGAIPNHATLRFDSPVSGKLSTNDENWYTIRTTEAGYLTVETSGYTDTCLEVYIPGLKIAEDKDERRRNARINILVDADTVYYIKLRERQRFSGSYSISARFSPFPNQSELFLDSPVSVNMTSSQEFWYRLRTTNAGILIVEVTDNIDTFLVAYDKNFNELASSYNREGLNARLEIVTEADKTYNILLRGPRTQKSFNILATITDLPPDAINLSRSGAIILELEEELLVSFRAGNESRWFIYKVGRFANFRIMTRGINTSLFLYDINGNLIAENVTSRENTSITKSLNPGYYYIEVRNNTKLTGSCILRAEIRR